MEVKFGICRRVFLIGKYAIKVPTTKSYGIRMKGQRLWAWTRGYQANYSEYEWRDIEGVAPVLWHFLHIVQVYPRCEIWNSVDDGWEGWKDIAPDLPFFDPKPENVGQLNGKAIWVDYDISWNGMRE